MTIANFNQPDTPRRLPSETVNIKLTIGDGVHDLAVSLVYDPDDGHVREMVFVTRGKIGQGLDTMLTDLGIQLSRLLQRRNPETGEAFK